MAYGARIKVIRNGYLVEWHQTESMYCETLSDVKIALRKILTKPEKRGKKPFEND